VSPKGGPRVAQKSDRRNIFSNPSRRNLRIVRPDAALNYVALVAAKLWGG